MNNKGKIRLSTIIYFILIIFVLTFGWKVYSKYNFYDYVKGIRESGRQTSFVRDSNVKYSEKDSYKIENKEFNDSMFFKTIQVEPNTAYKVTCMVKTENVIAEEDKFIGGAQICINDTTECSSPITGTNDWQEVTFMFNSNNRTSVELGFRLGGYDELCKGTAWFSDMSIEEGKIDDDTNWNMVCFIIDNIELENISLSMSDNDKSVIKENMKRVQSSIGNLSGNQMSITYDIIEITEPLTTISYDEENKFYVGPKDVYKLIQKYLDKEEYDYIYVAVRLGDLEVTDELVSDWIGLGSMEYNQIGYSNIRLPSDRNSRLYKYSSSNTFPQEVFIHEFLHTLERNEKENGNEIVSLHDSAIYGYENQKVNGLENWYRDYMQDNINNQSGKGLTEFAYKSKPIHESNFNNSIKLDYLDEPDNIIEELNSIVKRLKRLLSGNI